MPLSFRYLLSLLLLFYFKQVAGDGVTATQEECLSLKVRVERAIAQSLRESDEFLLQRGKFAFAFVGDEDVLDCEKNKCAFTNPKSPYGAAVLPLAKEEDFQAKYDDPRTSAYTLESFDSGGGEGQSRLWQLRSDEVVLAVGCTPPASSTRYFALTGYLSELFDHVQNTWVSVFGSLQDSLGIYREVDELHGVENRLNTSAAEFDEDEARSSAFSKLTVVLMSASKQSVHEVQGHLRRALAPFGLEGIVNLIAISKPHAQSIGLEPLDNYYTLLVRSILPEDAQAEFKAYAEMDPFSSWRLTPKRPSPKTEADLFEVPRLVPRRLDESRGENGFEDSFAAGLEALIAQIVKYYEKKNVVAHSIGSGSSLGLLNVDSGFDCVERKINFCNGDNRDAQYLSTYPLMLLDDRDKFAYVVGVNHRAAGLVVYNNIAVSDAQVQLGVRAIDDEEMVGSADAWLKGTPFEDMAPYYYAIRFARHCDGGDSFAADRLSTEWILGGAYCTEIPSEGPRAVPFDREILVNSRLYVNAATGVGPAEEDIVMPHMMVFTPREKHTSRDVRERVDRETLNSSPCMASFLSLTLCTGGISADCCNGVVSWTENNCFCDETGKLLIDTLPPATGERGLRVLSMICGKPALEQC